MTRSRFITVVVGVALLSACGSDDDTAETTTADAATTILEPAGTTTTEASTTTIATRVPELEGRLFFARFDESTHEVVSAHTAEPNGSDETTVELPEPYGGAPRFSHDGRLLAVATFHDDGRVGTAIITPDGTVERVLEIPDPTLNLYCGIWSPDDSRLVCEGWDETDESRTGVYEVSTADGGDLVRLTSASMGEVAAGDYTPDGTALLFKDAGHEESGPLMLLPLDGSQEPVLVADGMFENSGLFSPDGTRIVTSDGHRIIVLDLNGEELGEIVTEGYNLFGPVWSPDGEWIAYSGGTGGPFADIYLARPDGSEVHQVTHTPDNEIDLAWGPAS